MQLRDEYKIRQATKRVANTLEDLVKQLDDVDADVAAWASPRPAVM